MGGEPLTKVNTPYADPPSRIVIRCLYEAIEPRLLDGILRTGGELRRTSESNDVILVVKVSELTFDVFKSLLSR